MGEEIAVGDQIEWYSDIDGRPVEPDDPEARTYTGIVDSVHRHRDDSRVVAYLVRCRGGVSGTYLSTVLPEHRPSVVDSGRQQDGSNE
ncbi:hypothetical protein B7C42_07694 [Nocardia cerradoensis]|uniref:Hypervirulence associated protein TUDOR domain-containing protein n=1 Tax=Nocardia cerradoensis TaxID=85688 RepID=A0A231GUG3_9NOCA|nr:hypothetical protein [Nocardia cerradoensis]OXR40269.1 hypothetical protein B7C42_07694 [Nocardia cerradoensis]